MKDRVSIQLLLLLGLLLTACGSAPPEIPSAQEAGDFANFESWSIVWEAAETFVDVTVNWDGEQKTYFPEQDDSVFLAIRAEIVNTGQETEEMRFPQGPIYLTDADENVYDLVGVTHKDTILMAPPYLLVDKTRLTAGRWEDGRFFTVAYQVDTDTWFIQATPYALFHLDFLFVVPKDVSPFLLHFGNGMLVNIN